MQKAPNTRKNWLGLSSIAAVLLLVGCTSDKDNKTKLDQNNPTQGLVQFKGVWQNPGSGHIMQLTDSQMDIFHYNSYGCVKASTDALSDMVGLEKYLNIQKEKLVYASPITSPTTYQKLDSLPTACLAGKRLDTQNSEVNFEFFWHAFNDYYAFFDLRDRDWQQTYLTYRSQVSTETNEKELLQIFESMLEGLGDGHVSLTTTQGAEVSGAEIEGFPLEVIRLAYSNGEPEKFDEYYQQSLLLTDTKIRSNLIDKTLHTIEKGQGIKWGFLPGNIGYLQINSLLNMFGKVDEAPSRITDINALIEQEFEAIEKWLPTLIATFADSPALVIDVRLNDGGADKIAQKIAGYFTDQEITFATKQVLNNAETGEIEALKISPQIEQPFIKPIYVIVGQSSISAAEVFIQALKSLPHSTVVGQPTSGSVSDSSDMTMPNGWQISLSNQEYKDSTGAILEHYGVLPDVEMPVYANIDLDLQSDTPLDYILQQLQVKPANTFDPQILSTKIEAFLEDTKLPGIAVALFNDQQITWQAGFGLADVETNRAVTADTPFNVGSISKAVMATGIAQLIEQDKISLSLPINEMNLSFKVQNPHTDQPIQLKHLVTHSSGITDTSAYPCSYYIHGTEQGKTAQSLYNAFLPDQCQSTSISDPSLFFAEYLTIEGSLFSEEVFSRDEAAIPGTVHEYSNVASGLAGYAIEQYLEIDFAEVMQQKLFEPLKMHNTAWRHTELKEANPKAVQYVLDSENQLNAIPEYSYPTFFDGDLNTSAHDLARLMLALINGGTLDEAKILNEDSVLKMLTSPVELITTHIDNQGLFWIQRGAFIGHSGGDPGTIALTDYNTVTKSGYVILINGDDNSIGNNTSSGALIELWRQIYRTSLAR